MDFDAKPTETNIVLIYDRVLMSVLGANGIKPIDSFTLGWPDDDPKLIKKICLAYRQTEKLEHLIKAFDKRDITINLDEYLESAAEIDGRFGRIIYNSKDTEGYENG